MLMHVICCGCVFALYHALSKYTAPRSGAHDRGYPVVWLGMHTASARSKLSRNRHGDKTGLYG
eukprot:768301-Pleurochrysis_carterae.AAC.4